MKEDPADLLSIPITSFFNGVVSRANVYIKLSNEKFVLIFKKDHTIDLLQLEKYKQQKIEQLYVSKEDYPKIINKQVSVAGLVVGSDRVEKGKKTSILNRVAEGVYDQFKKMGLEEEAFNNAKNISEGVINLVNHKPELHNLLDSLNKISEEVFKHSMSVAFMAPVIGRSMEWTRQETLEKLSLGGLLHDIGKRELSPELLKKPRSEMSYEEMKEYESHAFRGMQIMSAVPYVHSDITAMIYEHHENSIGQGYPRRLWDMKINPLARVVSLANIFCELTLGSANYPVLKSPEEALKHIEEILGQPYNKQAFRSLKALIEGKK